MRTRKHYLGDGYLHTQCPYCHFLVYYRIFYGTTEWETILTDCPSCGYPFIINNKETQLK